MPSRRCLVLCFMRLDRSSLRYFERLDLERELLDLVGEERRASFPTHPRAVLAARRPGGFFDPQSPN